MRRHTRSHSKHSKHSKHIWNSLGFFENLKTSAPVPFVKRPCVDEYTPRSSMFERCVDEYTPRSSMFERCVDKCTPRSSMFERCLNETLFGLLGKIKNKNFSYKSKSMDMAQLIKGWHTLVRSWMHL